MVVLPYLTAIRLSGTDAGNFLHNQLSADVLAIPPLGSSFACYCEPKGRVLTLMLVSRQGDDYYIVMSAALAATVVQRLKIYVMRSRLSIEILNEHTVAGLSSPGPRDQESGCFIPIPLPESFPADNQWLLVTHSKHVAAPGPETSDHWKAAELQRGICWLSAETSAQFLPQMLGYEQLGAINYRKGCYPGQEIVARTHYLGKVKRHPRVLLSGAPISPAPMDTIQILSNGESYEAVVVDCGRTNTDTSCLFVVTRMEPDLQADQIQYQGDVVAVS